jgi:hypothetical protein
MELRPFGRSLRNRKRLVLAIHPIRTFLPLPLNPQIPKSLAPSPFQWPTPLKALTAYAAADR